VPSPASRAVAGPRVMAGLVPAIHDCRCRLTSRMAALRRP